MPLRSVRIERIVSLPGFKSTMSVRLLVGILRLRATAGTCNMLYAQICSMRLGQRNRSSQQWKVKLFSKSRNQSCVSKNLKVFSERVVEIELFVVYWKND